MNQNAFSLVGHTVGRIQITSEAGHGAMSSVYVGFDEKLQRQVAVKAIARRHRVDPELRARFLGEAQILSSLDHAGVCEIFEFIEQDDYDLLVMELVDGKRLTDLIGADLPQAQRLDIALQIFDVLSTVHGSGIIHRDLKPDNVMITKNGIVKVLDFGIASLTPGAEDHLSTPIEGSQTGVFGTLRSMSPEQARGEAVTPASDIFSLGLLLQELFTGRPAIPVGLPMPVMLAQAAAGETEAIHGLGPELTSLIEEMKSLAPGARPSAGEAAARLRRVIGAPRRRRRRQVVSGVWLVLIALSVGLAVQSRRAGLEASKAKIARGEAEELVEFILEDLHESLEPLGRLDLIAEITERTLRYYDQRSDVELEPSELDRHARGLTKLGKVLASLGRLTEAERAQRKTVEIRREMVQQDPSDIGRKLSLGWDLLDLERLLDYQGQRAEARAVLDEAGELARPWVDDPKQGAVATTVLSSYWDRLGALLCSEGDLAGCVNAFTAAYDLDAGQFAADPDEASRWNLSLSQSRLAELHLLRGDVEAAGSGYESALELADGAEEPGGDWLDLAIDFKAGLAYALAAGQSLDTAIALQREVLDHRQQAADHDAANLLSHHHAAMARLELGRMRYEQGQMRASLAVLEVAVPEIRAIAAKDPSDVVYVQALADALVTQAAVRSERGSHRAASELLAEARELTQGLLDRDPSNPAWSASLATTLMSLGESQASLGRPDSADELWRRALGLLEAVASGSDHPEYRLAWAQALALVGHADEAAALLEALPLSYGHRRDVQRRCRELNLPLPGVQASRPSKR